MSHSSAVPVQISSLQELQQLFPRVLMIDAGTLAGVLGIAYKTINNVGDSFPVPAVRLGRKKYYRLIDVANYIDNELGISPPPPPQPDIPTPPAPAPRRGRGRPRNVEARV